MKGMQRNAYSYLLGVCFAFLWATSCATGTGRVVHDRYLKEDQRKLLTEARIQIQEVRVYRSLDARKIEENARYILSLLFQKRNEGKPDAPAFSLAVALKEESFLQEYRPWNTITVEVALLDGVTLVYAGLLTEETESTLASTPTSMPSWIALPGRFDEGESYTLEESCPLSDRVLLPLAPDFHPARRGESGD